MWHPQTPGKSASLQQIGRSLLARFSVPISTGGAKSAPSPPRRAAWRGSRRQGIDCVRYFAYAKSLFLRATGLIRSGCNGCGQRFRWMDLTCGRAKPVFKGRLAEWRAIAWKEGGLAKLHAVVEIG